MNGTGRQKRTEWRAASKYVSTYELSDIKPGVVIRLAIAMAMLMSVEIYT